jgi:hypothetical protein
MSAAMPNARYKSMVLYDHRFSVGDTVMVKVRIAIGQLTVQNGTSKKGLDFIGKIEEIFTDDKADVQVGLRWYYRPEVIRERWKM